MQRLLILMVGALLLVLAGCGPVDVSAYTREARGAIRESDIAHAQRVIRAGLEKNETDPELLLLAVSLYSRTSPPEFDRPRLALHYATRSRDAASSDARTHVAVVNAYVRAGVHRGAREALAEGLARFPDNADLIALEAGSSGWPAATGEAP